MLNNVNRRCDLLFIHRMQLGQCEKLAGEFRRHRPAFGLGFGHAGCQNGFSISIAWFFLCFPFFRRFRFPWIGGRGIAKSQKCY